MFLYQSPVSDPPVEYLAADLSRVKAELDETQATLPVFNAAENTVAKRKDFFITNEFSGELMLGIVTFWCPGKLFLN